MPKFVPALGSAAVIVVVAALALSFYVNRPGGIGALPSPTPSESPTVAALPSVEPTAGASPSVEPTARVTSPPATQPPTPSPLPLVSQPPSQECVDFWDAGGPYRATAGDVAVTATVPAGWHGLQDRFYLVNSFCVFGGSLKLEATVVSQVFSDICGQGTVDTPTPAAVTAALAAQTGHETTGPTNVTLAGYPATRFVFSLPADFDASTCGDGGLPLWRAPRGRGIGIEPGNPMTVYVVDVNGSAVGIAAMYWEDHVTPAEIAELDAIVESLRFERTFTSTIHGISLDYPSELQTRPATEPWTGGPLNFDSPAADVIFDPTLADGQYLVIASQPLGRISVYDWELEQVAWLCPGNSAAWGTGTVDGMRSFEISCGSTRTALVATETRGYLIRLVVSSDEPGPGESYDWRWHGAMLETVDLRPEEAVDAEVNPE